MYVNAKVLLIGARRITFGEPAIRTTLERHSGKAKDNVMETGRRREEGSDEEHKEGRKRDTEGSLCRIS